MYIVNGKLNMLILLKEIFDKQDSIFWKQTLMPFFVMKFLSANSAEL